MLLEMALGIIIAAAILTGMAALIGPEGVTVVVGLLKFAGMAVGLITTAAVICGLLWLASRPFAAHRRRRALARTQAAEAAREQARDAKAREVAIACAPEQLRDLTGDAELKVALSELVAQTDRWLALSDVLPNDERRAGRHTLWGVGNSCLQMLDRPMLHDSGEARAQLALSARQTAERLRVGPDRLQANAVDDFARGLLVLEKQVGAR